MTGFLVRALALLACFVAPAQAQELTGTLKKIKETGTIVLGVRESSLPFSYIDGEQKVVGYSIDICMRIVSDIKSELKMSNLEVKTQFVTSSTRIPLMTNGTIDLECSTTTNNAERQKQVAFTNTHFLTISRFVAKKELRADAIEDLKGRAVVSVSGSVNLVQLNAINTSKSLGIRVLTAKDVAEAFLMVETGRADGFVMDDIQLLSSIATSKEPSAYAIGSTAFAPPEPYGIMMRRDDPQFKALVDTSTRNLYTSGGIKPIYTKWFEAPVPPKGLNMNAPASAALLKAWSKPTDSDEPSAYQ